MNALSIQVQNWCVRQKRVVIGQAHGQKRQMELADRAQKKRKPGYVRIPLDKIGFWPANRGNIGVLPQHVREVEWDCLSNKVRLDRYVHVNLVEIPAGMLADKEMCHAGPASHCTKRVLQFEVPQYCCTVHGIDVFANAQLQRK